jgi:phosphate transport system substrate-binding protein
VAHAGRWSRPLTVALYTVAAAGTAVLVAACGSTARPAQSVGSGAAVLADSPATLYETGSSLLAPQAQTWADAYQRANPGVTVKINSTSSGTGISAASAGKADIGASDAYLSSGDLVQSPTLLNIALTVSAQTVIYNLPGLSQDSHVSLDGQVLAEIYNGTITKWNDSRITGLGKNESLNLPPLPIVPLHRSGSSGDTFLFTSYLSTQDTGWDNSIGYGTTAVWPSVPGPAGPAAAAGEAKSSNMLSACVATPGCIGYNGISYLSGALSGHLGYASLKNNAGAYTLPTAPAIKAAVASFVPLTPPNETISMIDGPASAGYPIVNYEYAVVKSVQPDAAKASALKAFLRWVITTGNGTSYLKDLGFQPLSGPLVTLGEQQIAEIGS